MLKKDEITELTDEAKCEQMLMALDDIAWGIQKIKREIIYTASWGAPEGYLCGSVECTNTRGRCRMDALELADRIVYLKKKEAALTQWLAGLRKVLSEMKRPMGRALYLRYQKQLPSVQCAQKLGCSLRSYFRLRNMGLERVLKYMYNTEVGRRILREGLSYAAHRYFRS